MQMNLKRFKSPNNNNNSTFQAKRLKKLSYLDEQIQHIFEENNSNKQVKNSEIYNEMKQKIKIKYGDLFGDNQENQEDSFDSDNYKLPTKKSGEKKKYGNWSDPLTLKKVNL